MKLASHSLQKIILKTGLILCLVCLFSCASTRRGSRHSDMEMDGASQEKQPECKARLDIVEQRLATLENGMNHLNEKMDASRVSLDFLLGQKKAPESAMTPVLPHPSQGAGTEVAAPIAQGDPQAGFDEDAAVRSFRKAMILQQSGQYSEAILSFTSFLEKYPDHPFAGSAQFYTAEAYHLQNDERMAVKEYQKVMNHYPDSTHVTEALAGLADSQERLKDQRGARKTRDLLSTLFPHSPSANPSLKVQPPEPTPHKAAPALKEYPATEKTMPLEEAPPTAPMKENSSGLDASPSPEVSAVERSTFE